VSTWTQDDARRFAREGWRASLQRLRDAWLVPDADACMVALYEAVTWGRALDESLGETRPGRPLIFDAVRFARNRALHGLVLLVEPQLRGVLPSVLPAVFPGVLTWVHSDQIDRPAPEYVDHQGMWAFEHRFQTRPVLDTMLDVDSALT
jgi:hypothetical protein